MQPRRENYGLLAPPPPAGTPPPPAEGLKKLKWLDLIYTQITDAGCTALVTALASGALPALKGLQLDGIPASAVAKEAEYETGYHGSMGGTGRPGVDARRSSLEMLCFPARPRLQAAH